MKLKEIPDLGETYYFLDIRMMLFSTEERYKIYVRKMVADEHFSVGYDFFRIEPTIDCVFMSKEKALERANELSKVHNCVIEDLTEEG